METNRSKINRLPFLRLGQVGGSKAGSGWGYSFAIFFPQNDHPVQVRLNSSVAFVPYLGFPTRFGDRKDTISCFAGSLNNWEGLKGHRTKTESRGPIPESRFAVEIYSDSIGALLGQLVYMDVFPLFQSVSSHLPTKVLACVFFSKFSPKRRSTFRSHVKSNGFSNPSTGLGRARCGCGTSLSFGLGSGGSGKGLLCRWPSSGADVRGHPVPELFSLLLFSGSCHLTH